MPIRQNRTFLENTQIDKNKINKYESISEKKYKIFSHFIFQYTIFSQSLMANNLFRYFDEN